MASRGAIGALAVKTAVTLDGQAMSLLETFANNLALALERTMLAKESHQARLAAEAEKMRNVLLNSVSHDIRTPLTVIAGAAGALKQGTGDTQELADTIVSQSERLNRHVQNLLDMTRLEARTVEPKFEWHSIEELIGGALQETAPLLEDRKVNTFVPPGMALVRLDGILVTKALINLLENAARHTPEGTDIEIRVSMPGSKLRIQVADRGPGIPKGEEDRIFDKFYQPAPASGDQGFGLGLAICKSVAEAHGGRIWADNGPGGGARFYMDLSLSGQAPEVALE
jgi:two-component system sensor histidine kinase KdpD